MERKKRGERRRERDEEGMREREIDGGVIGWEKEGDWKREIEREKGEWNRCAKIVSYNEYELSVNSKTFVAFSDWKWRSLCKPCVSRVSSSASTVLKMSSQITLMTSQICPEVLFWILEKVQLKDRLTRLTIAKGIGEKLDTIFGVRCQEWQK